MLELGERLEKGKLHTVLELQLVLAREDVRQWCLVAIGEIHDDEWMAMGKDK